MHDSFERAKPPLPPYLYQPGKLEGGRHNTTDHVWSLGVYKLGRSVTKSDEPALYYLQDGLPDITLVEVDLYELWEVKFLDQVRPLW